MQLIEDGLVDGVIWAMGQTCRAELDESAYIQTRDSKESISLSTLFSNKDPHWIFPFFAPQRSILSHSNTTLYFTHGGGSSANEGLYHGKPMLAMGIFADQIANSIRLAAGGVAESLNKFTFSAEEVYTEAEKERFERDVLRLQRIAHVCARRKYHAADLVEEVLFDHELRLDEGGKEVRPMHLQTADMRISWFKARNWDLYALGGVLLAAGVSSAWMVGAATYRFGRPVVGRACGVFVSAAVQK